MPPKKKEPTKVLSTRIVGTIFDVVPEPRGKYVFEAVLAQLKKDGIIAQDAIKV